MDDKYFKYLIEKHLNQACTPEEEKELMAWYDSLAVHEAFTPLLTEEEKQSLQAKMLDEIQSESGIRRSGLIRRLRLPYVLRIAASLVVLFASAAFLYYFIHRDAVYKADFGEIRTVLLPDNSEVILNGNSSLRYSHSAENGDAREAWLDGEAFFKVEKKNKQQRFIVHLADTLSINVIGTEFNVMKRASGTEIALVSGKIELNVSKNGQSAEIIEMNPNDVVSFKKNQTADAPQQITTSSIGNQLAWQQQKIILDDTSLAELTVILRETHGIEITAKEERTLSRKASGSIPIPKNKNQLMNNIIELYGLIIMADLSTEDHFVITDKKINK